MDERNKSEEFNANSGKPGRNNGQNAPAYDPAGVVREMLAKRAAEIEKLDERDRMKAELVTELGLEILKDGQANYERFKGVRIRKEEDRLYGQLRADLQAPRPEGVEAPRMPPIEDIRRQARENVEAAHGVTMKRLENDLEAKLDRHIAQARQREPGQQRER